MRYMIDTNICIFIIKNKPINVINRFLQLNPDDICISSITYSELSYGVYKSKAIEKNKAALLMFLSSISILPFDDSDAEEYGKVRTKLEKDGTPIGPMDLLIASHAKNRNLIVVTNNTREFERVDDLKIEDWTK